MEQKEGVRRIGKETAKKICNGKVSDITIRQKEIFTAACAGLEERDTENNAS